MQRKKARISKNTQSSPSLDFLFHPRAIAIVGVSNDLKKLVGGRLFLKALIDFGYKGKLYPVNRGGGEIFGLKIYSDIKDIPDSIDHVIMAIPAQYIPQLILDCASLGVKTVRIFSSGFKEIDSTEGQSLEAQLTSLAHQTGIRILGPNCMGLYCPKTRLTFLPESPKKSGPVGFLSQSGYNTALVLREGTMRGVYFSKAVSYGNACDLNECDLLEYFTQDPETEIIAGYIEGVADGARFMQTLKQAAKIKPVIFYKAGTTAYGGAATASHTGSLAGSEKVWASALKQAGAIQVHNMEELIAVIMLFMYMSPTTGRNIALIGMGGGALVQATDECAQAGLDIPPLPLDVREKLKQIYNSEAGSSFRNPIDMYWGKGDLIRNTIKVVADYEPIDLLVIQIAIHSVGKIWETQLNQQVEAIVSLSEEIKHRTVIALRLLGPACFWPAASKAQSTLVKAGFPVYPATTQAANAIIKFTEYHRRRETLTADEA